jgi:hypothetical protein
LQSLGLRPRRMVPVCPDSPALPLRLVHRWYSAGPGSGRGVTSASGSTRNCSA